MGKKYSSKRPNPKHTKKNSGGGMRIAAESFKIFFIINLIEHLTQNHLLVPNVWLERFFSKETQICLGLPVVPILGSALHL